MINIADVRSMHNKIAGYIKTLSMEHYPALDEIAGNGIKVLVKPEVLQATRSFKVRNAFAALCSMSEEEKQKGMIAASTGNLGQAFALAGSILNVPVTICVKENNNPKKNAAIKNYGAQLIEFGSNYDEAYGMALKIAAERGIPYIRSSEHKNAYAGAATVGFEIFSETHKPDRVVVAVGSGAHASGTAIAAKALSPNAKVVGIQAANSCTIHDHWHKKDAITPETETIADAISMGPNYFSSSVNLLTGTIDEFITATEKEIMNAITYIYKATGYVVEPAGAIGFAGIIANKEKWKNETIAIILSGGNLNENLYYLLN